MVCYNHQLKDKVEERFGILFQEQWLTTLRKHTLDVDHRLIAKNFEEEVNNVIKSPMEKNLQKKPL
jgi:hypothetical protein